MRRLFGVRGLVGRRLAGSWAGSAAGSGGGWGSSARGILIACPQLLQRPFRPCIRASTWIRLPQCSQVKSISMATSPPLDDPDDRPRFTGPPKIYHRRPTFREKLESAAILLALPG